MDPATITLAVAGISALLGLAQRAAEAVRKLQTGEDPTPEEQDALRAVQQVTDEDFDAAVDEARKRTRRKRGN